MNKKLIIIFITMMGLCGSSVEASPTLSVKSVNSFSLKYALLIVYLIPFSLLFYAVLKYFSSKKENGKKMDVNVKHLFKESIIGFIIVSGFVGFVNMMSCLGADKPIIYIYPETETIVQVSVGYPEKLSCVYPEYDTEEGWKVIAQPNGDLVDTKTGRNLYCLYWEGNQKLEYKFKDGFVVAGEDSAKFLEEKLAILGLTEREANEFIIYWLPKLEVNKYNLIRFETAEEIETYMPLNIEPKPDSVIRVMMDFKGLNKPIEIEEQKLETPIREGYTVVEWGGSEF